MYALKRIHKLKVQPKVLNLGNAEWRAFSFGLWDVRFHQKLGGAWGLCSRVDGLVSTSGVTCNHCHSHSVTQTSLRLRLIPPVSWVLFGSKHSKPP